MKVSHTESCYTKSLLFNWYCIDCFKLVVSKLCYAEPTAHAYCVKNVHNIEFCGREGVRGGHM